eukprot:scaffold4503_cov92-Isochrysis_galbana.AAC.4
MHHPARLRPAQRVRFQALWRHDMRRFRPPLHPRHHPRRLTAARTPLPLLHRPRRRRHRVAAGRLGAAVQRSLHTRREPGAQGV